MINIQDISKKIADAASERNKIAMFHYQVLVNAEELRSINPVEFCREVNVPESYATEFLKMIKLASLMGDLRMAIKPATSE